MVRKEIVEYFEGFVASFNPPLVEGVTVTGGYPGRRTAHLR